MDVYYNTSQLKASQHLNESIHGNQRFALDDPAPSNIQPPQMTYRQTDTVNHVNHVNNVNAVNVNHADTVNRINHANAARKRHDTDPDTNATPHGLDAITTTLNTDLTEPAKSESTSNELLFNWDSTYQQQQMQQYKTHTQRQIQFLDRVFEEQTRKTNGLIKDSHDYNGKLIINNTSEREWFRLNVALLFSVGCIFNERDRTKFDNILRVFQNTGNYGFLMNFHKVMNYTDKLVQTIETTMEVANGNYHVCLFVIVQTSEPNELAKAPEEKYKYAGLVEKHCEWDDIYRYIQTVVARYGLLTRVDPVYEHLTEAERLSWEIGQDGMSTKTAQHSEVESSFDIDIDPNDENQIKLSSELEFKSYQSDHFAPRTRNTHIAREERYNTPNRNRYMKNGSLYKRIQESNESVIPSDSMPENHHGVQYKMNATKVPPSKVANEYQLYDDDETYQDGKNVISFASNQATRQNIQQFQHVSRTSSRQGNRTRVPTGSPLNALHALSTPTGV